MEKRRDKRGEGILLSYISNSKDTATDFHKPFFNDKSNNTLNIETYFHERYEHTLWQRIICKQFVTLIEFIGLFLDLIYRFEQNGNYNINSMNIFFWHKCESIKIFKSLLECIQMKGSSVVLETISCVGVQWIKTRSWNWAIGQFLWHNGRKVTWKPQLLSELFNATLHLMDSVYSYTKGPNVTNILLK